jgi:hypothetical protein
MKDEEAVSDGKRLIVPRFAKSLRGVALPSFCVKCGRPADSWIQRKIRFHAFWLYLVFFLGFGLLIEPVRDQGQRPAEIQPRLAVPLQPLHAPPTGPQHVLVWLDVWLRVFGKRILGFALFVSYFILRSAPKRRMEIGIPLCAKHTLRRKALLVAAWTVVAALIAYRLLYGNFLYFPGWQFLLSIQLLLTLWLYSMIIRRLLTNPIRAVQMDEHQGVFKGCSKSFLDHLPAAAMPGGLSQIPPPLLDVPSPPSGR